MPPRKNVETQTRIAGAPADRKPPRRTTKKTAASPPVAPPARATSSAGGDDRYAPTAWGSAPGDALEDLLVPSGQLCQVRRPGVEGLLKAGVLHDLDSLTAIVDQKHIKRAKGQRPEVDVKSLKLDDKQLENILHVTDRIVCYVVVQPPIQMTPNDPTRRDPGVIYTDMVDVVDKMFILNYAVGGTRELERFRGELDDAVRGVDPGEDVEDKAE